MLSNDGYLDDDVIDEIDIRITSTRDIFAVDSKAKTDSFFIGKGALMVRSA